MMRKFFVCMLLSLIISGNALSENKHDEERSELKTLLRDIESALNKKDLDLLASKLHKDVVITFLNGEVARGVPAVREYFSKTLGSSNAILSDYKTSAKESAPADIYGNVALADGVSKDEFVFKDGTSLIMNTLWTTSLVKQETQWKVMKLHFSTNVFDNPVLATAEKSIMIFAAIAAVLGIIIGFFIGRKTA